MGVKALLLIAALGIVGKTGAIYDAKEKTLTARGAAAGDVRAPSGAIARTKSERLARERARKKIVAALVELKFDGDPDEIADQASIKNIEYGSDGSVELTLTLDVSDLQRHK